MIAIIADIHGNYPALKAVLKDIESSDINEIYSLGDVAGYYSMINECIELLRNKGIPNIMGNHDYYLTNSESCPRSNAANSCLNFQRKIVTLENVKWLKESLPLIEMRDMRMVHGGWRDYREEYIYNAEEAYFTNMEGKYFFSGHTHVQFLKKFDVKTYCNPGSIGQPRDGDNRAAYALIDNEKGEIILKRVCYPIDEIALHMKISGFSAYFYENLYNGSRIGGIIDKIK